MVPSDSSSDSDTNAPSRWLPDWKYLGMESIGGRQEDNRAEEVSVSLLLEYWRTLSWIGQVEVKIRKRGKGKEIRRELVWAYLMFRKGGRNKQKRNPKVYITTNQKR